MSYELYGSAYASELFRYFVMPSGDKAPEMYCQNKVWGTYGSSDFAEPVEHLVNEAKERAGTYKALLGKELEPLFCFRIQPDPSTPERAKSATAAIVLPNDQAAQDLAKTINRIIGSNTGALVADGKFVHVDYNRLEINVQNIFSNMAQHGAEIRSATAALVGEEFLAARRKAVGYPAIAEAAIDTAQRGASYKPPTAPAAPQFA